MYMKLYSRYNTRSQNIVCVWFFLPSKWNDDQSRRHEDNFSSLPLQYLWVNDHKGNSISGRDHNIFCSSPTLGTPCTAKF